LALMAAFHGRSYGAERYALGARRDHRHICTDQQVRQLLGVADRLIAEAVV
jgi:hypothetical protein